MHFKQFFLLVFFLFLNSSFACEADNQPNANTLKGINIGSNGITTASVREVIQAVEKVYAPRLKDLGIKLAISNVWGSQEVNAVSFASGDPYGSVRAIHLCGGLARHPKVSLDVLTMVLCHEIGHELGGYPGYRRHGSFRVVEGQADYFASLRCFKAVMKDEDNIAYMRGKQLPKEIMDLCARVYKTSQGQALCQRNALAGYETIVYVWQSMLDAKPNLKLAKPIFQTSSKIRVERTLAYYPELSCRVETHLRGSLCNKPLVPFLSRDDAWDVNVCQDWGEERLGARPTCWYAFPEDM